MRDQHFWDEVARKLSVFERAVRDGDGSDDAHPQGFHKGGFRVRQSAYKDPQLLCGLLSPSCFTLGMLPHSIRHGWQRVPAQGIHFLPHFPLDLSMTKQMEHGKSCAHIKILNPYRS